MTAPAPGSVYHGRLETDGNGNLLASGEDDTSGFPVAYDADQNAYLFLAPGDPSHNMQHGRPDQLVEVVATQDVDPELPGFAGTAEDPTPGMEHHFPGDDTIPLATLGPDALEEVATSHTDAYTLNVPDAPPEGDAA